MLEDIRMCRRCGASGVVIGALDPNGDIDMAMMERLVAEARGEKGERRLSVTFHRAFDECADPVRALDDIIGLECDRLLTSGHEATAYDGRFRIAELVKQAAGRIVIMAGCGVRAGNIDEIERNSHADEFHSSSLELFTI